MGTKAGGGRYSFSLLMAHRALRRILTATEQPQSLTAGEAENEAQESLDRQRKRVQLGKEEQPHRAGITALKYSMSSS